MVVLDQYRIKHKIARLSYEILENNENEEMIIMAGINNNGYRFAELICASLETITSKKIILTRIKINPANPLSTPVEIDPLLPEVANKTVIIVDDVANSGRTIFYAFKVFLDHLMEKIEVAVLVDRKHKLFPVKVDYVGLSLATTVHENIKANLRDEENMTVVLS
ncbi:MAG: phosphoribosyltransferase family protein [Saprospiraceae bacterium]|nr:phosphoribosyltransferase [Saprospiraceae bacterium]MBP6448630.1 phosphoribosyltransferase [Saprospiraceae bacterium]